MTSDAFLVKFMKPLRVLVIEDNLVDQRILESMLTESPHTTTFLKIAGTFSDAINLLSQHEFEIVVLDLNLPDSRGTETLQKLNNLFPKVAIVVNTGAYEDELGLQTLSLGAQDFLLKGKYNAYVLNKVLHYCLERKRLELELKTVIDELKETQNQLILFEKMKVVGGLASGVAHEVKNPLATILYGVTYLSENIKVDHVNYHKVLSSIKEAANRANQIVTDLLDFSSLSKINQVATDINQLIDKGLDILHYELEQKKIRVSKDRPAQIQPLLIDANRIEQVIVNLILNAVQAMDPGGHLEISARTFSLPGDLKGIVYLNSEYFKTGDQVAEIIFSDSGHGILDSDLNKIFDPFYTTRRAQGGVGLGLAVCKNIMDIHKGAIHIKNRPTGGISVSLFFRIPESEAYVQKKNIDHRR